MNPWFLALMLFISGFLTDLTWVFYVQALAEHARTGKKYYLKVASWWSVGTGLCTLVVFEGIMQNFWVSLVWLVGLWCGTRSSAIVKQLFGIKHDQETLLL